MKLFAALVLLFLAGCSSAQQNMAPLRSWRTSHYDSSLSEICYLNSMCRPNATSEERGFRITITDAFYHEKTLVIRVHLYKTRQEDNTDQRLLTTFVQLTQIDFAGDHRDLNDLGVRVGSAREWPLKSQREMDYEKFYYLDRRRFAEGSHRYGFFYFFQSGSNYLQAKVIRIGPTSEISDSRTPELVDSNGNVNHRIDISSLYYLIKEFPLPTTWFTREQFYDNSYGQILAMAFIPVKIELDTQEATTFRPFDRTLFLVYFREQFGNLTIDLTFLANLIDNNRWYWPSPEELSPPGCNVYNYTHPSNDVKLIAVSAIRPLIVRRASSDSFDDFYFFVLEFHEHRDYPNQHRPEGTLILLRKFDVFQFGSNMWRLGQNDARRLPIPNEEMFRFFGCPVGEREKPEVMPMFWNLDFIVPFKENRPYEVIRCAHLEDHPFGTVDCSSREFDRVPSGFDTRTDRALISGNQIRRLDNYELANCGLWNASTIELDHNLINSIDDLAFVNLRVTHLYLRHNRLSTLNHNDPFQRVPSLTHLYLDSNQFGSGSTINLTLAGLHRITYVSMISCGISDSRQLVSGDTRVGGARLQTLDLNYNQLDRLPAIGGIHTLQHLNLVGNRFVNFSSDQFQSFSTGSTRIVLSNNHLRNSDRTAFSVESPELTLDLSRCSLQTPCNIDTRLVLSTIIFSYNQIRVIDNTWCHRDSRIRVVDFSHNLIDTVNWGSFQHLLGTLQIVDLSSNFLQTIDMHNFAANYILPPQPDALKPAVNLANNTLRCDCRNEILEAVIYYHHFEAGQSPFCTTGETEVMGMSFDEIKLRTLTNLPFYPHTCQGVLTLESGPMSPVHDLSFWAVVGALLLVGVALVVVCILFALRTKGSID